MKLIPFEKRQHLLEYPIDGAPHLEIPVGPVIIYHTLDLDHQSNVFLAFRESELKEAGRTVAHRQYGMFKDFIDFINYIANEHPDKTPELEDASEKGDEEFYAKYKISWHDYSYRVDITNPEDILRLKRIRFKPRDLRLPKISGFKMRNSLIIATSGQHTDKIIGLCHPHGGTVTMFDDPDSKRAKALVRERRKLWTAHRSFPYEGIRNLYQAFINYAEVFVERTLGTQRVLGMFETRHIDTGADADLKENVHEQVAKLDFNFLLRHAKSKRSFINGASLYINMLSPEHKRTLQDLLLYIHAIRFIRQGDIPYGWTSIALPKDISPPWVHGTGLHTTIDRIQTFHRDRYRRRWSGCKRDWTFWQAVESLMKYHRIGSYPDWFVQRRRPL